MYICLCKAVTDRKIRQAVKEGACSVRDLQMSFGLGTCCGKCVPSAREVLDACLASKPEQHSAAGIVAAEPLHTQRTAG